MANLRIAEIFASIQGEGSWVGTPSVFVRVSGCNLRCAWCDTPYASWQPEGSMFTVAEVFTQLSSYGVKHVVVTGGEPMLFEPVVELCALLRSAGHLITIETAGTVFREVECDLMSISPKLSNSSPSVESGWREKHEATRRNLSALRSLIGNYNYQLKFVASPTEIPEIKALLSELGKPPSDRVMLMAEGRDSALLHEKEKELVSICLAEGWRLSPRFHLDLFGDTRGT